MKRKGRRGSGTITLIVVISAMSVEVDDLCRPQFLINKSVVCEISVVDLYDVLLYARSFLFALNAVAFSRFFLPFLMIIFIDNIALILF